MKALEQIVYFRRDVRRMLGRRTSRIFYIWLTRAFVGVLAYRLERFLYLLIGAPYAVLRLPLIPVFFLLQAYSNIDIPYKADIKGGLLVLHPAVGAVISGLAVIGEDLVLIGGNVIGGRPGCGPGEIELGDRCMLGANAVVLGPVRIASDVNIGAMACVVRDCVTPGASLVGVPAVVQTHVPSSRAA